MKATVYSLTTVFRTETDLDITTEVFATKAEAQQQALDNLKQFREDYVITKRRKTPVRNTQAITISTSTSMTITLSRQTKSKNFNLI